MLGGWAVYFIVNTLFEKERGHAYLGSRDIDLGFKDIETAKKVMAKLTELGFKKVSFRFFKELHTETMKELSKEEKQKHQEAKMELGLKRERKAYSDLSLILKLITELKL